MSAAGLVTGLAVGSAVITATADGRNATLALTVADGGVVGQAGGVVTAAGGNLAITIPAGAVSAPTAITVDPVAAPPATANLIPGTAYELGPALTFAQPVTVRIRYAAGSVPTGVATTELRVGKLTGGEWQDLAGSTVDVAASTATGASNSFSTWGVVARLVGAVTVAPAAPTLSVGGTVQLAAAATDRFGNTMPPGPATWTSQSPAVVSVGATTGLATAVAAGTAAITATRGGKSANVTVTVNPVTFSLTTAAASPNGGGGTITCSTSGAGGPFSSCAPSYTAGTTLTLQSTPDAASNFTGWTATVCSGTGTCQFTLAANATVTGNFARPTLTVPIIGTGTVSSTPAGISNCAANCTAVFNKGTVVSLTAGTGFAGWNGGGCSGTGTCQVALNTDTSVMATFSVTTGPGRIAYINPVLVPAGSIFEIFTINPDGTGRARLTFNAIDEQIGAEFSRDGSRVAFSSFNNAYVMNADGTNVRQLTFFNSGANNVGVTISPDGTKVAFSNPVDKHLYVIDADGTNLRRVTTVSTGGASNASFSPDGTRLVFDRIIDPLGLRNLHLINLDGTNEIRLTGFHEFGGSFSPDGTKIVFQGRTVAGQNGFNQIFVMNADGSNRAQLLPSNLVSNDQFPRFSLDGTLIAFDRRVSIGNQSSTEIFVMNANGTNVRQVTFLAISGTSSDAPRWVP